MSKAPKAPKAVKEKKPRKARAVMRSRKDSVAGHYADKLRAAAKHANDVMAKVEKFPGVAEATGTDAILAVLETLAAEGYKPARGKGGNRGPVFTVGQQITLSQEARDLLRPQFPSIDAQALFVGAGYTEGKQIPVRAGGSSLTDMWIGFVWKKSVSAV